MQFKLSERLRKVLGLVVVAAFVALSLSLSPGAASASSPRRGELHVTKECSQFGDGFCTITSSNIRAMEVGSKVVYASTTMPLNTDIRLEVGPGNAAFGHCAMTPSFVCTFSGGTGQFTHFQASVDVSWLGGVDYAWDGTYSFSPPN